MVKGSLEKLAIGTAVFGSVLVKANQLKAATANWDSISDVVPNATGSINYSSSNSSVLPNILTAICYVTDPADGVLNAIGGFDLVNGVITHGYYNRDWNPITGYGLNDGDTANTGPNSGNSYSVSYRVFYDADGDGNFGLANNGVPWTFREMLNPTDYSITGFTSFGTTPGTFTFNYIPEPSASVLFGLGAAGLLLKRKRKDIVGSFGKNNIYRDGSSEKF